MNSPAIDASFQPFWPIEAPVAPVSETVAAPETKALETIDRAPVTAWAPSRKLHSVALPIFAKLGCALGMISAVMAFSVVPVSVSAAAMMLVGAVAATALELAVRLTSSKPPTGGDLKAEGIASKASSYAVGSTVASGYTGIALHEAGHATAALACFKGADPRITINPFKGGSTSFVTSGPLTGLGQRLGLRGSMMFITAAGMLASVVTATALIVLGTRVSEEMPTMGDLMTMHGVAQIVNEVSYGISTFFLQHMTLSHDFYRLWVIGGIHPAIPLAVLITVPIVGYLFASRVWKGAGAESTAGIA